MYSCLPVASYNSISALYWYQIKKVGVGSVYVLLKILSAMRQVVFTDVQITILQRVAVLPVLGYWSELCSYWLTQNRRCRCDFSIYQKEDVPKKLG
jgi:hypothetical protein